MRPPQNPCGGRLDGRRGSGRHRRASLPREPSGNLRSFHLKTSPPLGRPAAHGVSSDPSCSWDLCHSTGSLNPLWQGWASDLHPGTADMPLNLLRQSGNSPRPQNPDSPRNTEGPAQVLPEVPGGLQISGPLGPPHPREAAPHPGSAPFPGRVLDGVPRSKVRNSKARCPATGVSSTATRVAACWKVVTRSRILSPVSASCRYVSPRRTYSDHL